jgi:hypothetical protein
MLWYGFLVMRDEHTSLACRQGQDLWIVYPYQPGSRCGLERERRRRVLPTYHDLDALAGTWSEDDAAAFLQTVASFEHVDLTLWQ